MSKFVVSIEIRGDSEDAVRKCAVDALSQFARGIALTHHGQGSAGINGPAVSITVSTLDGRIAAAEASLLAMKRELAELG